MDMNWLSTLAFAKKGDMMRDGMDLLPAMALQLNPTLRVPGEFTAGTSMNAIKKEDRIPQWGNQETKDFIAIRAELEKDFTQTKRNKNLWEIISNKMKESGHRRSAEQCKWKWKNLVSRYKVLATPQGREPSESDRQSPFFEELRAILTERAENLDRILLESESGAQPKKKGRKGLLGDQRSSEDLSDEAEEEDESEEERQLQRRKKRKAERDRQRVTAEKCRAHSMHEVLEEFFQQQNRIEMEWREAMERKEQERRRREQEWRDTMEKLEKERMVMEQLWREREEQRRAREEARAEKMDMLFTALLTRLDEEAPVVATNPHHQGHRRHF